MSTPFENLGADNGEPLIFEVQYDGAKVVVHHNGAEPPPLSKPGLPVVLEGRWDPSGKWFDSERLLVKHTEDYREGGRRGLRAAAPGPGEGGVGGRRGAVNAALGTGGVVLGLVACVGGIVTLLLGLSGRRPHLLRSGATYALMALGGSVIAVIAMERALITRDFSVKFVAENGSHSTPALYNVATMWSALEGSILLWSLVLSGFTVAVVAKFRKRLDDQLVAWALLTMLVVGLFFFALMLGPANPFRTIANPPIDGPGPNPLLQNHPLMAFHPPILYLGYVGFTVPFAFAIAALVTGRVGEGWLVETRRWTLLAWTFLTVGIALGAWWSHEVLGWGGYWAWDPVENASFLPWLTGTAYLHSVMVQERRGMLRVWNLSLLCATFALTILGTFLTRSGILDSVHSFTESPIGPWLLSFFGLDRRGHRRPHHLARRPAPLARTHRLAGLARGRVPVQQHPVRRLRLRRPARHGLPARLRGAERRAGHRRRPVLQPHDHAHRAVPAVPHGDRPGPAVAQGVGRDAAHPPLLAGLGRRGGDRAVGPARRPRVRSRAGVRPRRLRRRGRRPPDRARHPPPGLAGVRRPRQRRHDRPPRRADDRRRVRGVEQLPAPA